MTVLRDYLAAARQPPLAGRTGRYDEVADASGQLRPAWRGLAAEAQELTTDRLRRVRRDIGRFLADDGVTYARPGGSASGASWRLDPLPVVIGAEEWSVLEAGLAQRAELLDRLVRDLYGERRVLSSGVLPSAVVHAHPGYLRSLARPGSRELSPLLVTATDLGRTTSGEWRVLADRTQAPSGLGYAMENRRVLSRTLPDLYRQAGLHRMAPYFQALRSTLLASAPADVQSPRVVVLTPGSRSETAYDQAFLASSLGFPLVQGEDLTVRDGTVWMRVLGRLERVDVVWRRVDATSSDPLELDADSRLGVPGLSEAVRRGTVHVVNGLGAGVLENPALLPYLSRLCEVLLDEPLRLGSRRTLWLGDPDQRREALDALDGLEVRSVDGSWRAPSDRAELLATIDRAPYRFVAQEAAQVSQAPTLDGDTVRPVPLAMRTFTLRYGAGYRPLMGGLASVLDEDRAISSKDVWVVKASPDEPDQGLTDVLPMTTVRAPAAMVLRVLEDMFWFGRYAERAEDGTRLVLGLESLREDHRSRPRSPGALAARVLADVAWSLTPGADPLGDGLAGSGTLASLLLEPHRPGSVAQSLAALRNAAVGSRDQFSSDVWLALATVDRGLDLLRSEHSVPLDEAGGQVLTGLLALQGVTANMMRDATWRLIELGRTIERTLQLVRLLQGTVTVRRGLDVDRQVHQAVLAVAESAVTHRRRYRDHVRAASVLELLLLDAENPRSLRSALGELTRHLAELPASTGTTRPERLLEDLRVELDRVDVPSLAAVDGEVRPHLVRLLSTLHGHLTRLADAIAEVHLASGPTPQRIDLRSSRRGRTGTAR